MMTAKDIEFYDRASGREMKLALNGPLAGWLCYKHPDGQWVTERKATPTDRARLQAAVDTLLPRR